MPSKNQQGRQNGINRSLDNSGIFVNGQICGKSEKLLVDTGATLTISNDSLYCDASHVMYLFSLSDKDRGNTTDR